MFLFKTAHFGVGLPYISLCSLKRFVAKTTTTKLKLYEKHKKRIDVISVAFATVRRLNKRIYSKGKCIGLIS